MYPAFQCGINNNKIAQNKMGRLVCLHKLTVSGTAREGETSCVAPAPTLLERSTEVYVLRGRITC